MMAGDRASYLHASDYVYECTGDLAPQSSRLTVRDEVTPKYP